MKLGDPDIYRARLQVCQRVDAELEVCVRRLEEQGARRAALYLRRARKSVQGAARHAIRLYGAAKAQEGA